MKSYKISKKFGYRAPYGCKFCKSRKVHWADTEYGWKLFEKKTGELHKCLSIKDS